MTTFIKSNKKNYTIAPAVLFSLLMHIAAGAFLIFCLSVDTASSPQFNGINLVWISLEDRNTGDMAGNKTNHPEQKPTVDTQAEKRIDPSISARTQDFDQAPVIAAATLVDQAPRNDASAGETMEISGNNIGYIADANSRHSDFSTVIAYPLYKENSPPEYPAIARVRGYEGIVLVSAQILPDGRVGDVRIRKSSGYSILDQSAVQAVKPWKFEPAKKAGNPFTAWVELPIRFILRNNSQS
ncbi:MAG: energy transducer TonB [Smithella sp.]|nr:energy transducer TonB [Smithella sp.]